MASHAEVLRRELLRSRLKKSAARHHRDGSFEPIQEADRSGPLPLSFAQQRLWFITQLDARASTTYHLIGGARLTGQLDRSALRAALQRIVARHEVLRTWFEQPEGVAIQVICPAGTFALQEWDWTSGSAGRGALAGANRDRGPCTL